MWPFRSNVAPAESVNAVALQSASAARKYLVVFPSGTAPDKTAPSAFVQLQFPGAVRSLLPAPPVHTAVTGTSESTHCHVMRVSMSSALLV